jgi:hypothetical protein
MSYETVLGARLDLIKTGTCIAARVEMFDKVVVVIIDTGYARLAAYQRRFMNEPTRVLPRGRDGDSLHVAYHFLLSARPFDRNACDSLSSQILEPRDPSKCIRRSINPGGLESTRSKAAERLSVASPASTCRSRSASDQRASGQNAKKAE